MAARNLSMFCLLFSFNTLAADKAPAKSPAPAAAKKARPKLDLGLPATTFSPLPNADGLTKKPDPNDSAGNTLKATNAEYTVVRVTHAKAFIRSPEGSKASAPYEQLTLAPGNMTEKFTTVVRVKCPQKTSTSIEVAILDPRADTLMEAKGQLSFRGEKQDEADYTVDWEPTFVKTPGTFQVLVRIGGQPFGPYPLKVGEAAKK